MTDPDLLFTAKIRNLTENELVVFFIKLFSECGETGIRTPGTSRYNGFQDRRNRPLCHLSKTSFSEVLFVKSGAKVRIYFKPTRVFTKKITNIISKE